VLLLEGGYFQKAADTPAKRYFRTDPREFVPGDEMPPPGDHLEELQDELRHAEMLVREVGCTCRAYNLYVFADKERARWYWLLKKARYLYEVEVQDNDILHTGDMNLLREIANVWHQPTEARKLAEKYREGGMGDDPLIELVVRKARVTQALFTPDQRNAEFKKTYQTSSHADCTDEEFDI
jgi:hypothetical protein